VAARLFRSVLAKEVAGSLMVVVVMEGIFIPALAMR